MKTIVAIMALFIACQANANTECVSLDGVYKVDEVTAMRFSQNACISLKIEFGQIKGNGKIEWYRIPIKTLLNGTPTCDTFGCIKGNITKQSVELYNDTAKVAYDNVHGDCSFKNQSFTKNSDGSISRSQDVYECRDGYAGQIETTLSPLN